MLNFITDNFNATSFISMETNTSAVCQEYKLFHQPWIGQK